MRINALKKRAIVPVIAVDGYQSGATWLLDTMGLPDIEGYQWKADGVDIPHITAAVPPLGGYIMQRLSCLITYDSGKTIETPAQKVHMVHSDPSHNMHDNMLLAYVGHEKMNFIAKQDGNASDPATWYGGVVPGESSSALIPWGVKVTMDFDDDVTIHDRWRIDGELEYAQDQDVTWVVHTIIGEQDSVFRDGTAQARLNEQFTHQTIWADRAPHKNKTAATKPDVQTDQELMTGGYVSLGVTDIWGRKRDTYNLALPMPAGSNQATIVDYRGFGRPALFEGLRVNDQVVIAGTKNNHVYATSTSIEGEDEIRTVTNIETVLGGHVITFDQPLDENHTDQIAGRGDCYVPIGVYKTANIIFRSQSTAAKESGHFMMMHAACEIDLWGVDFWDMGRTSKKQGGGVVEGGQFKQVISLSTELVPLTDASNVIGRYSGPHAHRTGRRAVVEGVKRREIHECCVYDSIGFGFVHHDCHLNIFNCFAYNFWGSAFVSEQGSETGAWIRLCAIKTTNNPRDPEFVEPIGWQLGMKVGETPFGIPGDVGRGGWGAFNRSRATRFVDCAFASCGTGVVFFHRSANDPADYIAPALPHNRDSVEFKYIGVMEGGSADIDFIAAVDLPIRHMDNIRTLACIRGFEVSKAIANQKHDNGIIWSNLIDFGSKAVGISPEYVGTYGFHWCQATTYGTGILWTTNTYQCGNVNCQVIAKDGMIFTGAGDPIIDPSDLHTLEDFRWFNISPVYDCTTSDESGALRNDQQVNTLYTDITHKDDRYGEIDWELDPYTTFLRKAGDWNGTTTYTNLLTNTNGRRVDGINALGTLAPKPWFSPREMTGPANSSACQQWRTKFGFWKDGSGRDILVLPRVITARDSSRIGVEWYTVEGTTLDAFGGAGSASYKGVFNFTANPIVKNDIYVTCPMGGTVDITPNAGATGGNGTISVLDHYGRRIVRQPNNGELEWSGETVTFTPDNIFYGATEFVVVLHSGGKSKTVVVHVLVDTDEGQEVPLVGTHFTLTGGAGQFNLALIKKPNCYPRKPRDVVYSTDAGSTWRLAAIDWALHTWPISKHSNGDPLLPSTVNVLVKYVTDYDRTEVSAASQAVTIT